MNRKGKVWFRSFPDIPVSRKATDARMGKGKGLVSFWVTQLTEGQCIIEVAGVPTHTAIDALKKAKNKLSLKTKLIIKSEGLSRKSSLLTSFYATA